MKILTFLAVLLLPLILFSKTTQTVTFLQSTLPEARQQAAQEGKLLFVHFAAGWCMPCQWMEQHTFADPVLAAYLDETYLGLRADVDAIEGRALQQQYDIKKLPTILAFNSRGQLLGRHEGAMEAEELLEQLQAYDLPANRQASLSAGTEDGLLSSPRPVLRLSRPALVPDVPAARPVALQAPEPTPATSAQTGPYDTRHQPVFFSIQAGLFSSYENAVRESTKLERQSGEDVHLAPDSSAGQIVYRIYLGRFGQREDAQAFLYQLEQKGVNGFVKEVNE
ncbi:MAG: thioredoxin family protein [Phaeodactylibacter sp.]|nr:thioredoxin family protein [Phaeodactylibacter sp.]MCB9276318.1 thioredoxin family protein [Lewinellaceae bacterium]